MNFLSLHLCVSFACPIKHKSKIKLVQTSRNFCQYLSIKTEKTFKSPRLFWIPPNFHVMNTFGCTKVWSPLQNGYL